MIRLKHISLLATLSALVIVACGDDGDDTNTGAGGSGGNATGGSAGKSSGGSAGKASGGSAGKGSGGSAGKGSGGTAGKGSAGEGGTGNEGGGAVNGGAVNGGADSGGADNGGADNGGAGGAGPEIVACPASEVGLSASLARAICLKQQECCSAGQTLDACITATQANLDEVWVDIAASVANNRSELSCANFDTCVAAINDSSCRVWPHSNGANGGLFVDNAACRQIMVPQLTASTACERTYECIDGYCATTCSTFAATEASCTDGICDLMTDFCFDNGTPANDADDVCRARFANGASCTEDTECESGTCDLAGAGLCIAPAVCEWVAPDLATACSVSGVGRSAPLGTAGVGLLLGLAALGLRRRRR